MTSAQQIEPTIFHITINPDPNSSVGPKVGERPGPTTIGLDRSLGWERPPSDHAMCIG